MRRLLRESGQHSQAYLRAHIGEQAERMHGGRDKGRRAVQRAGASRCGRVGAHTSLTTLAATNEGGGNGALGRRKRRAAPHTASWRQLEAVLVAKQPLAQLRLHALHSKACAAQPMGKDRQTPCSDTSCQASRAGHAGRACTRRVMHGDVTAGQSVVRCAARFQWRGFGDRYT